jgi:hypothetical protein
MIFGGDLYFRDMVVFFLPTRAQEPGLGCRPNGRVPVSWSWFLNSCDMMDPARGFTRPAFLDEGTFLDRVLCVLKARASQPSRNIGTLTRSNWGPQSLVRPKFLRSKSSSRLSPLTVVNGSEVPPFCQSDKQGSHARYKIASDMFPAANQTSCETAFPSAILKETHSHRVSATGLATAARRQPARSIVHFLRAGQNRPSRNRGRPSRITH